MKDFNGNGSFGWNGEDRQMHEAVCDDCGRNCKVPFKPNSDKPIYCSECFNFHGDDRWDRWRNDRQMHDVVCDDCWDDCQVPFKPTWSKPIYCNDCFGKSNSYSKRDNFNSNKSNGSDKKQDMIIERLDKIIILMEKATGNVETDSEQPKKEIEFEDELPE